MSRLIAHSLICATLLAATAAAAAPDAQSVVREAARAIGGDSVRTLQYSASGFDHAVGQQAHPDHPWPKFIEKRYTRSIDYDAAASKVERVRQQGEHPPRGGGGQPIAGEQAQTQVLIAKADVPWSQQADLWVTPHGFLRLAAQSPAARVETRRIKGKPYQVVTISGPQSSQLVGYINDAHLIERVETVIDNAVLGDLAYESIYSDYRDVGDAKFPHRIVQRQGGHPIYELVVSDARINVPVAIEPPAAPAPPAAVQSQKIGEGIYLIGGGYQVLAIDFKDHITLVESGQNEARANAVIAEAKRLIPGKPIKNVINTHPHFDHSGGLRTFVANDITIVTHQSNKAYLQRSLARARTAGPPAGKPRVAGVGDRTVLSDGERVVELHRLQDFGHHDAMLVAYLPKEKILFEADAYNPQPPGAAPPNPASPYNVSLLDNITRLKLDVERIIPVHSPSDNRVVTLAELQRWIRGEQLAQN